MLHTAKVRPRHQTRALVEISMSYGAWNGPEGRGATMPPQFRNFSFRPVKRLLSSCVHDLPLIFHVFPHTFYMFL